MTANLNAVDREHDAVFRDASLEIIVSAVDEARGVAAGDKI